jgi:hypothetical protein
MMKPRMMVDIAVFLVTLFLGAEAIRAEDEVNKQPLGPSTAADAVAAAQKEAREVLAKFDKEWKPGDQLGTWKVRMEALVRLARAGPAVVPVLTEALHKGPPSTREFAAQALVHFAEPSARPALERALADPTSGVRLYAIQALSMLGRLEWTKRHEQILSNDPNFWSVRTMMAAALARDDRPNPAQLRELLADYDLRRLDSARVGDMAPDFTLTDFSGKAYRLSQFRGKKTVVLRFILFDF